MGGDVCFGGCLYSTVSVVLTIHISQLTVAEDLIFNLASRQTVVSAFACGLNNQVWSKCPISVSSLISLLSNNSFIIMDPEGIASFKLSDYCRAELFRNPFLRPSFLEEVKIGHARNRLKFSIDQIL